MSRDVMHDLFGQPLDRVKGKRYRHVNMWLQEFCRHCTLIVLGTRSSDGEICLSPRGGKPGFIGLSGNRLRFCEAPGNKLFESISNLQQGTQVGLMMIIAGVDVVVRVNGRGQVIVPEAARGGCSDDVCAVRIIDVTWEIEIDNWYYHCARALRVSELFNADFVARQRQLCQELVAYTRKSDEFVPGAGGGGGP